MKSRINRGFGGRRIIVPSYRNRVIIVIVGLVLCLVSVLFTSELARKLRDKENAEVALWAKSIEMNQYGIYNSNDPLMNQILDSRNNIPFIITNENLAVIKYNLVPTYVIDHPDLLRRRVNKMSRENTPLAIENHWNGSRFLIFFSNSKLQKTLKIFPFIQISVIVIFIMFGFITFRTSQEDEQNKVWIGLAKETAHQLGTPISSLLGWVEYLRTKPVEGEVVGEMEKDLTRLMKVADRFSKIGSETILSPANVNEVVGSSVMYFRTRIPRNVTLNYNGLAVAPMEAMLNAALFEWVVENLLNNSLDALQGQGEIDVRISDTNDWVYIDIRDTGKGIPKSNFKRVFEPGYSTKTRGWGLGLSLSKRIIEEYHKGKIYVADSEPGKGATFRIALKRLYG
jgi:anti-sigma regulatory factor (Ser/Thr protein kinase)